MPGDYYFDEQWALHNTGQSFYCVPWFGGPLCFYTGTADADIDAPEAWAISTGSPSVTVAVIDSGIDYNHLDLAANYDGGDDFVSLDGDPMDDHGHGTHVAGTIAAALDNLTGGPGAAEGVAGVAPDARIRAYKVCRSDGTCDDFAIQQAIARAVADGAKVINMSLGGAEYSQSLDEAVQDAWDAGIVIVAAAGNDGTTTPFYPAALDHVVSVAAFDKDHRRPSFSNYGNWVDIAAPGNVIMSTYPRSRCSGSPVPGNTGCYTRLSGTSMAAPHVSGAAALVWSRSDAVSNGQVVDILLGRSDHAGVSAVRLDAWTVNGGLNVHDALTFSSTRPRADAGPHQTVADANDDGAETVVLDGSRSTDSNGSIVNYEWREGSTIVATGVAPSVLLPTGVHTLTLEVTDNDGETATDDVVVTVNHSRLVTVTASTPQAAESGPSAGIFTISRTGDPSVPLAVAYTVSGTAVSGSDYVALPGSVTIDAGAASTTDEEPERDVRGGIGHGVLLVGGHVVQRGVGQVSWQPHGGRPSAFSHSASTTVTVPAGTAPGVYFVIGVADYNGAVTESVESNNTRSASVRIGPDLIVPILNAPSSAVRGTSVTATDTVRNQGGDTEGASVTKFFLSTNGSIDAQDVLAATRSVPAIGAGLSHAGGVSLAIPPTLAAGTYCLIAQSDGNGAVTEAMETNNTRSRFITISAP